MGLSLDHYTHGIPLTLSSQASTPLDTQLEIDAHLHNIRSSPNAHNRWFDKAVTLIVESNTRAGAMGEHSPVDALVPSIVAEYAVVEGIDEHAFLHPDPSAACAEADERVGWRRLDWVADDTIERECMGAEERAKAIIQDSDDSVLWFTEYGTDWIKGVGMLVLYSFEPSLTWSAQ
jgi:carnitine O-acetyltransferase